MICGSVARSAKAHSRNFLRLLGCRRKTAFYRLLSQMRNASAAEQEKNFNFYAHSYNKKTE